MNDYQVNIKGHDLEYFDDEHLYLVDGVIVPSITQILEKRFDTYKGVPRSVLEKAADKGTMVHNAIELYCTKGIETPIPEVRNFKSLMKTRHFKVLENELPVILFDQDEPIAAGRFDLTIEMNGMIGGADIKRVSSLAKDKVTVQLNLYRIAYRQCYDREWEFLKAIVLREDIYKFVDIPINEKAAWSAVKGVLYD